MDIRFLESDAELHSQPNNGSMMCIDPESMDFTNHNHNHNPNPNGSMSADHESQSQSRIRLHSLHNCYNDCTADSAASAQRQQPSNLSVDECVTSNQYNAKKVPSAPSTCKPVNASILVSYHDEANGIFGCKHYARNCFLKAECCDEWYVCRLCHDEMNEEMDGNHEIWNRNGRRIKPHKINRYLTKLAKCMRCGTEQKPSKYCGGCTVEVDSADNTSSDDESVDHTNSAMKEEKCCDNHGDDEDVDVEGNGNGNGNGRNDDCNVISTLSVDDNGTNRSTSSRPYMLARYFCEICKFYDDTDGKEIFHCPECGLCRLGRPGDYIHCKRCGCCLNQKYYEKHPCIENSLQSDCPICFNYLFKSREPVTFFMPCGHPLHYECLKEYGKVSNKCPICRAEWYDPGAEQDMEVDDENPSK